VIAGWWMLRRTNYSPRLWVSGFALAAMILLQFGFDLKGQMSGTRPPRECSR
jgi:hypothetical protein